jgi:hypothetical protein
MLFQALALMKTVGTTSGPRVHVYKHCIALLIVYTGHMDLHSSLLHQPISWHQHRILTTVT